METNGIHMHHNQTVVRPYPIKIANHNQTVVRPRPFGLTTNHNQILRNAR